MAVQQGALLLRRQLAGPLYFTQPSYSCSDAPRFVLSVLKNFEM